MLTVYRNSPKEITEEWNLGLDTGSFSAAKINGTFHSTITLGEEERECVRGSVEYFSTSAYCSCTETVVHLKTPVAASSFKSLLQLGTESFCEARFTYSNQ